MNTLITTAISYTNGDPHIGHLYEALLGDFITRVHKIAGYNTKFLTGTDEHGEKIEETAKKQGKTSIELCDFYSNKFKNLNTDIQSDFDYFIRTSQKEHEDFVIESIKKANKDIYFGYYEGWYNVREESFVTDLYAKQNDFKDPISGLSLKRCTEENYKFGLSKYQPDLSCVFPQKYQEEMKSRTTEIKDISISRTGISWGIPFPGNDKHIVYVWFDALLNYVTGSKILFSEPPKVIHLIGKDITWFHAVIYPAILKSCGYNDYLPHKILVHGFILDKNGLKMSKSLNNVISVDYLKKYPIEAIRNYFILNTVFGEDFCFNEEQLVSCYNNELLAGFGNLFQRFCGLVHPVIDLFNSKVNPEKRNDCFLSEFLETYDFQSYKSKIKEYVTEANKIINMVKPWTLQPEEKVMCLITVYHFLHKTMFLLYPVIPNKIEKLLEMIGNNLWISGPISIQIKPKAFEQI